jgi:hypothetical protein
MAATIITTTWEKWRASKVILCTLQRGTHAAVAHRAPHLSLLTSFPPLSPLQPFATVSEASSTMPQSPYRASPLTLPSLLQPPFPVAPIMQFMPPKAL